LFEIKSTLQRKFVTNLGLLLLLNFLIKPFWIFGIDRTVQNTLSAEDYGTYFALFNFSMLFNILLDFGVTNFNNRNIAQNSQLLAKYFSGIVVFKMLLAVIYFIITFVVGYFAGYDALRFKMLLFLAINQFLISFIQYLRSNIAGLQLFALDSFFSVLDKTLMIIFCGILIWGNWLAANFTIMHFVYGQTLAYVIAAILVFAVVLAKTKRLTFKINKPFLILIIKQTAPFALLVLTMTFYYRLDAVMLDYMLVDGEYQAAIYAKAYRLMDAANQIGVLFAGLLLPMFAYMIKQKQPLNKLIRLSFSLIFIPSVVLALICWSSSKEIMNLLYNEASEAIKILPILMFCFVAIASTYIFGTLLTANNNLKQLNILAILGLFLNFGLNYLLIPYYEAYGSAVASMITQFFVVVLQVFIAKKVFNFPLNLKFVFSILVIVVVLLLATYLIKDMELTYKAIIIGSIGLLLSFVFQLITLQKIKDLLVKRL
jgi:O-antigen/teichoic acid export membrane protein